MKMDDGELTFEPDDICPRQRKLFDQYERYLTERVKDAYERRGRFWNRDFSSPEAYETSVEPNRQHFRELVGGWPADRADLGLEREPIAELDGFTVERVHYTIRDGIRTDALLLLPAAAGPHPAVLCQIGVNGVPETLCGFTEESRTTNPSYNRIGQRLARRGYVVLATRMVTGVSPGEIRDPDHRAPHLMTDEQREICDWLLEHYDRARAKEFAPQTRSRTYLTRLCRTIGMDLMGVEMFALSRGVDLLCELPEVRSDRLGMYGKSQGGMSALWLGALDRRLAACVASASFTERLRKQIGPDEHRPSFLLNSSEDKILPHLQEFADSDLASLICPRAFGVEAGKQDDSVWWPLAERAFAEVKAVYERLDLGERCEMFLHEGGHEVEPEEETDNIRCVGFLDRWLRE
ncbi:MAG: hypothetical protein R6V58_05035 [Planctomycetota bacterium]